MSSKKMYFGLYGIITVLCLVNGCIMIFSTSDAIKIYGAIVAVLGLGTLSLALLYINLDVIDEEIYRLDDRIDYLEDRYSQSQNKDP